MTRLLRFSTLDEAEAELDRLDHAKHVETTGLWSFFQILTHTAQALEFSITQYPGLMPALVRRTIGRVIYKKLNRDGYMRPGSPNPRAPKEREEGDAAAAMKRLRKAIKAFRQYEGTMAIHPAFDQLNKAEFEKLHAMHIAHHLSFAVPSGHVTKKKSGTTSSVSLKKKPSEKKNVKPGTKRKGAARPKAR